MILNPIRDFATRNVPGPGNQAGDTDAALPSRSFFTAEWRIASIGPKHQFVAIVGRVDHDGVVGCAKFLDLVENRSYVLVVLDHPGAHEVGLRATLVDGH